MKVIYVIIGIILLILSAVYITEYQTVGFYGVVTINDLKQDGSPNLQVTLNEPHTLETWVCPLSPSIGSLNNYFYVYNPTTGEKYRSPDIVPGSPCQWVNVEMADVKTYDKWGIQYWKVGTNRGSIHIDSVHNDDWFNFEEADPCLKISAPENICDGFNLYSQKCVWGDIMIDKLIQPDSVTCGCIIQETPNICDGYDLWSQKQTMQCVEGLIKDQLIETNSDICGYTCTVGETKSYPCTDGTPIITQRCIDNTWTEVAATSCPLNWINLEMILRGYIEDIKLYMEKLL